ncbi:hypothetical protein JTE90_025385 [Oedothorax gibbosus]|uniref:Major facilitator superfamily (MFS) profile domain-containing protein n=1 Tax=Oedothorax gibbosus TaxID=931172 RepID=A0AAV6TU69_9ARAC|nr:hypothetical protein JTE90_025385 [Oedothorax gibbosus]
MNKIFILSVPQHWCNVPELSLSNLSISEQRQLISPPSDPSCSMFNVSYARMVQEGRFEIPNDTEIIPCRAGWKYDTENYDETVSSKFDLVCENNYFPSLIFTLSSVGSLVSATFYGYLSDKFGRKIVFLSSAGLIVVTEVASALANDLTVFIALRILKGTVAPTLFTLPFVLVSELVSANVRADINGIVNTSWTLGMCLLPLVAYLSRHWANLCYITAGSGAFLMCYWRFIPESPSWLLSQDKFEEAKKIMIEIGEVNGNSENEKEMLLCLKEFRERILKEKEDNRSKSESKSVIFRYPRLRKNFFVLAICWLTFNVTYGGLTYNLINLYGNEFINFFLICVAEFPGNFIFWYAMNNVGRRWTATFGFFLTGLFSLLPVIGFKHSDILSSMIGKFLITGCFMVSDQQGTELFPTVLRTSAIAAAKSISSALGLFVPFIAYLQLEKGAIVKHSIEPEENRHFTPKMKVG